jgi:glutamate 5-kinase
MTIVIKFGSGLVVDDELRVRTDALDVRAREIAALVAAGERVCIVSSGAIALGLAQLGLAGRRRSMPKLQAASAAGQPLLHAAWSAALAAHGLRAAQVLLTRDDVARRVSYVNVRNALHALLDLGVVPVVNENDATATDEIAFGDNDALAAHVAVLLHARLLVLLTEVEGVLSAPPGRPDAVLVEDGAQAAAVTFGRGSPVGRGGMASKVRAAEIAAGSGVTTVIAGGHGAEVLEPAAAGSVRGTWFAAAEARPPAFKLWLRHAVRPVGRIAVDDGARRALVDTGASLLSVGVTHVDGDFARGDAVELVDASGTPFAKGLATLAAHEISGGGRDEVVHRDRLALYRPRV